MSRTDWDIFTDDDDLVAFTADLGGYRLWEACITESDRTVQPFAALVDIGVFNFASWVSVGLADSLREAELVAERWADERWAEYRDAEAAYMEYAAEEEQA